MFFKLIYTIKPLDLGGNEKIEFSIKEKEHEINIELKKIPDEELKKSRQPGDMFCTATTRRDVTEKRKILFETMKNEVPSGLSQFLDEVRDELYDSIIHSIRNFRWKRGIASSHNFIRFGGGLQWSFDDKKWAVIPGEIWGHIRIDFPINKKISSAELANLQELLTNKIYEPLGHELFCEAWELRNDNPRSALVLGIAAAETGFKECVGKLTPQAGWLVENIQSPPLIKMLKEFLPTLPVKNKIRGKIIFPPKKILDSLHKGITIRNEIVHGKNSEIRNDTLEEVLRAVRDLLYLLDFYCGITWAADNISVEATKDLICEADKIK